MADIASAEGRRIFGQDPAGYDRARPGYPEEVYDILRERCGLGPGTRVFEIGPGTGKVTRRLLRHGAAVTAVEPDERLAAFLAANPEPGTGTPDIRIAPFEEADLPGGGFDLGVAATSFHWLDQETALAKVAALLRPGGWWAMWWNIHGDPLGPDPFREATTHLLAALKRPPSSGLAGQPSRPAFALDAGARLSELRRAGFFDHIETATIRWTVTLDTAGVKALYATFSPVAILPQAARRELLDELGRIADTRFGGRVERPMLTPIYTARRA